MCVERLEWTSPHAYLYRQREERQRQPEEWVIEIDSPNFLKQNGWTSATVKPGDIITCTGGRGEERR